MRPDNDDMIVATVIAMREKLNENNHKKPITGLSFSSALGGLKGELVELTDEILSENWDFVKIRRELADVVNYAGACIFACDRLIEGGSDLRYYLR